MHRYLFFLYKHLQQNTAEDPLKLVANLEQTCHEHATILVLYNIIYSKDDAPGSSIGGGNLWKELSLAVWDNLTVGKGILSGSWAKAKEKGRERRSGNWSGKEEIKWRGESIWRIEAKTVSKRGGVVRAWLRSFGLKIRFIYPLVF